MTDELTSWSTYGHTYIMSIILWIRNDRHNFIQIFWASAFELDETTDFSANYSQIFDSMYPTYQPPLVPNPETPLVVHVFRLQFH